MNTFQNMGLFAPISMEDAKTWEEVIERLRMNLGGFKSVSDFLLACAEDDVRDAKRAEECLDWLGMTSNNSLPSGNAVTATDLFCERLEERLQYDERERDMILMHHSIGAEFENGSVFEEHTASLRTYGDVSVSAMCKAVGYTCAAATELVLDAGSTLNSGLLLPTDKAIYSPILETVKQKGIIFKESCKISIPDDDFKVV